MDIEEYLVQRIKDLEDARQKTIMSNNILSGAIDEAKRTLTQLTTEKETTSNETDFN